VIRFLLLWLALAVPLAPAAAAEDLLEPEKAFRFSARALGEDAVEVSFAIADGYYMYRERFKFEAQSARLGPAELPRGLRKKDEFFGDTEVYRNAVHIRVPVAAGAADPLQLVVTSQGCADIGVCYVPMESRAALLLAAAPSTPAFSEAPRRVPESPRWSIYASDLDIAALFDRHVLVVIASSPGIALTSTWRRWNGWAHALSTSSRECRRFAPLVGSAARPPGCASSATPRARPRWAPCASRSCPALCSNSSRRSPLRSWQSRSAFASSRVGCPSRPLSPC
jgi:hypothetical protein